MSREIFNTRQNIQHLEILGVCKYLINGAPGEIRTPDLLVRSQALYPTELRAHTCKPNLAIPTREIAPGLSGRLIPCLHSDPPLLPRANWPSARPGFQPGADPKLSRAIGGEGGIRTLDGLLTHTPLAGARLRPLGHLSGRGWRPKSRSAG